ncbi:MAG TPA: AI-2E family transporter, partial [Thermoanaerobaculia bacterium]
MSLTPDPLRDGSAGEPEERPREASPGLRSLSVTGLLILASFYTLYFARSFFLPIILAFLLSLLLAPIVRGLKRLHLPEPVGAGIVILALLTTLGFGLYQLSGPAAEWMNRAPQSLRKVETRLRDLRRQAQSFGRATDQVANMARVGQTAARPAAVAGQ